MDSEDAFYPGGMVAGRLRPIADIHSGTGHLVDGALRGSRCEACGVTAFPVRNLCMACGARAMVAATLPTTGRLYAFTTVHVSSSRPTPYAIGYVDLDSGVRLLASVEGPPDQLICDAAMRLQIRGEDWLFVPQDGR